MKSRFFSSFLRGCDAANGRYQSVYLNAGSGVFEGSILQRLLRFNGNLLDNIPADKRSAEICHYAVSNCPSAVRYVPENIQTNEMCVNGVKDGVCLSAISKARYTSEICLIAVENNYKTALPLVPNELATKEMYLAAVKNGLEAKSVPQAINISSHEMKSAINEYYTNVFLPNLEDELLIRSRFG